MEINIDMVVALDVENNKLIERLLIFCKDYCQKSIKLQTKIEKSIKICQFCTWYIPYVF